MRKKISSKSISLQTFQTLIPSLMETRDDNLSDAYISSQVCSIRACICVTTSQRQHCHVNYTCYTNKTADLFSLILYDSDGLFLCRMNPDKKDIFNGCRQFG